MVDHLTTVTPDADLGPERQAEMASVLEAIGFELRLRGARMLHTSAEIEAQTAKTWLRAHGFRDREFGIVLEFSRRRGTM